jgi:hypothetical protein
MPFSLFGKGKREPAQILEAGWQLYAKPTTLEPVGTIFRIDRDRRRFMVDELAVAVAEGNEVAARVREKVRVNVGFFARFLGLESAGGELRADDEEVLEFEIVDTVRQVVSDAVVDRALEPVLAALKYKPDNRYYIIRDCRSATAMTYRLTREQLGKLGAKVPVNGAISAGATIHVGNGGLHEIDQKFPERMRVMFLAEEIGPLRAGLAAEEPVLGRLPVRQVLVWSEG